MAKSIFLNLPVRDLNRTKDFFSALGYTYNEQFTDENAACMVVSDTIYVMLLRTDFFKGFTDRDVSDAKKSTEAIIGISAETREEVDSVVAKAVAAGGRTIKEAVDYGFMYQHGFEDLDGHLWEIIYMDPSAVLPQQE